ncbi:MAG: P-loop NTPase [Coriobacteriaceae bacterium]|nr:P-loop NTPase [Coriobacteriaceae bacterium]
MSGCWVVCCNDGAYAWARGQIAMRGEHAAVVRAELDELDGVAGLLGGGDVRLMVDAVGDEGARAAAEAIGRLGCTAMLAACVVRVTGANPSCVQWLLAAGASEVIAVGGCERVGLDEGRDTACEAHRENACDGAVDHSLPPCCDDLTPIEELWTPLDEPDDEISPPVCPDPSQTGEIRIGAAGYARSDLDGGSGRACCSGRQGDGLRMADSSAFCEGSGGEALHGASASMPRSLEVTMAAAREHAEQVAATAPHAPLITVVSGRGGVGKTTLVASMASAAARAGLRAAVLDLDLMFGDLPSLLGVDAPKGLERLVGHELGDELVERNVEGSAMRVGPGLTLWGPLSHAERAEFYGAPVEQLIGLLRGAADVIFADTSGFWGDAVAVAVALCDRCLVVGSGGQTSGESATRAVALATRLGVPATRMTSVFNRFGAAGCGEEEAMRFEMGASLHSRLRISDGGRDVQNMVSFGHLDALMAGDGAFASSVRSCTAKVLEELGCRFDARLMEAAPPPDESRAKFRLPWHRGSEEGS